MDPTLLTVLIGLASAIVGAGGVTPLVVAIMKNKLAVTKNKQDFTIITFTRLEDRIAALEKTERECMQDKEKLAIEVGVLREKLEELSTVKAQLKSLTRQLKELQSHAIVGHIECDHRGIITAWNDGSTEIFGFSKNEILGLSIEDLMPAYARTAHKQAFIEACKASHTTRNVQLRDAFGMHKNGHTIPLTIILNSWTENENKRFDAEIHRRELGTYE